MARWTPEARAKQAEVIKRWKPWVKSTGPVTSKGKKKSSRNWKRGNRGSLLLVLRQIRRAAGGTGG